MNDNQAGGTLLVAGNAAGIITMVLHPVAGHGLLPPAQMAHLVLLDRTVHGLAIVGVAMTFLGLLALTRRLTTDNRLPLAAMVAYGFAAVAILSAACMSGFVGADLLGRMVEGDPKLETWQTLLAYTFRLNQGFSAIYTVGACVAVALWSVAALRNRRLPFALGIYGLAVGLALPAALFAGALTLDVHGFGLVVFAQAVWFVGAGFVLRHADETAAGVSLAAG